MSEIRADKLHNASGDNDSGIDLSTNDVVAVKVADSEKARINSSGVLMVGQSTFNYADVGCSLTSSGQVGGTANGDVAAVFNRKTSDGDIATFRKDNTEVGNIGIAGSGTELFIEGSQSGTCGLFFANSARVVPRKGGSNSDNSVDMGHPSFRFDDIYATNSTIQTSDQQEKNTIEDSDLGLDFIKRLSPKSYIFNGKTRTHYGLIAQDIENVLTDIGKTGSDFAGFVKTDISEEEDGSQYRYGLRYTEFVAPLIKAIKEQQTIIENLQARITALESE